VAGLAASFGSGAMTNSINEISDAACIFAIGTNTTANHPIIGRQVTRAIQKGAKLIVADPRRIPLCRMADIWLRLRPGTNIALLNGMMRAIIEENLLDTSLIEERCEDYEAFEASVMENDLATAEQITGVPARNIVEAARMFGSTSPATILYTLGITEHSHGTDNVQALANLALLTGNIGKPSTGVNPLRGQNNVQGACDMGALPNVYTGYQKVENEKVRRKFEKAWNCKLSPSTGLTLIEMFEAARKGKIKALYLMGEDPVVTNADTIFIEKAISHLELFVVQDIFLTETARLADVVLPAASFAEKDGTFTNTERRVQRVRKAIEPKGNSRPDWMIICDIVKSMGAKGFDFGSPQEVFEEMRGLTPSYGGITYERIEKSGLQWPCPDNKHPGTPYLYSERFNTPSGLAKFIPILYRPPAETTSHEYPFVLITRRSAFHYHAVMTHKAEGFDELRSEEHVEIHPADADSLEIKDGEIVKVTSRRGSIKAKTKITEIVSPGVVCMTFNFAETRTNILTSGALDPIAKTPEFKVCAVKIEREESAYFMRDYMRWGTGENSS
jgi:formate dehydrogenase alpha subunit